VEQPEQVSPELKALQNLMVSGQISKAKEGLLEYTKEHPKEALAHALLGQAHAQLGSHGTAIDSLKIATALEPGNTRSHLLLANVYKVIGWIEQEEEQYTQILVHEPDNLDVLVRRVEVNFALGRYNLALEDAEYAISVHPQDSRAYLLHGRVGMVLGDIEAAVDSFRFVEVNGNIRQREIAIKRLQEIADALAKKEQ
jgi:tetratricopeptide (TPR) repeat protein